ncbi:MAG: hypothetical protein A2666_00535 [Parcubacteria group bacterium RIFCSPHIGHO2_01_FULL_47_10b]|nr:MAG: hypothetical protein A2666_00535 [Parcubacteria group bacterium RIFCSPHIGHO2_01_FULL_47_10b]
MEQVHQTVYSQIRTNAFGEASLTGMLESLDGRCPLSREKMCLFVDRVTDTLRRLNLGQGDEIAVVLPNGPSYTTALLAVIECGIAVPMPPDRLFEEFGKGIQPRAVLFSEDTPPVPDTLEIARACGMSLVGIKEDARTAGLFQVSLVEHPSAQKADERVGLRAKREHDLALILNTSGTTGQRKRVGLSHANLIANAQNIREIMGLTAEDRYLAMLPQHYTYGLNLTLAILMARGTLIAGHQFGRNIPAFTAAVIECLPTFFASFPCELQAIVDYAKTHVETMRVLQESTIRLVSSGGTTLSRKLKKKVEEVFGCLVLENSGMTETGTLFCNRVDSQRDVSVGLPVPGLEYRIIADDDRAVDASEIGSLFVRGPNVGRYLDPSVQHERLTADGYLDTQDIASVDEAGFVHFHGRRHELIVQDGRVLVPGILDEILEAVQGVRRAISFWHEQGAEHGKLAVCVVPESNVEMTLADLKQAVLDSPMVDWVEMPDLWILCEIIPHGILSATKEAPIRQAVVATLGLSPGSRGVLILRQIQQERTYFNLESVVLDDKQTVRFVEGRVLL